MRWAIEVIVYTLIVLGAGIVVGFAWCWKNRA